MFDKELRESLLIEEFGEHIIATTPHSLSFFRTASDVIRAVLPLQELVHYSSQPL
jgi:hypothetical protein